MKSFLSIISLSFFVMTFQLSHAATTAATTDATKINEDTTEDQPTDDNVVSNPITVPEQTVEITPVELPKESITATTAPKTTPSWGVGLAAGYASGVGFAIRKNTDHGTNYQLTFGFYGDNDYQSYATFQGDIGFSAAQYMFDSSWSSFRIVEATAAYYVYDYNENAGRHDNVFYNTFGFGFGLETDPFKKGLTIALDLLMNVTLRNLEYYSSFPCPQVSIIYNF